MTPFCGIALLLGAAIAYKSYQYDCSECLKLPDNIVLSGEGNNWEYYHFVTDFAPMLYASVRNRSPSSECAVVYANGPHGSIENPGRNYHIVEKWDFIFGKPFNLKYEYLAGRPLPARCPEVSWKLWGIWASGPAGRFTEFRAHAHIQAGIDSSTPPAGVILIWRGKLGQERRSIDERFYDAARKALDSQGVKYQTLDLELITIQEQIRAFANARVAVGQHGAGLSNINWMKDDTTVVELGTRNFLCYENLAHAVNLNYVWFEPAEWTEQLQVAIKKGATQLATMVRTLIDADDDRYLQLAGHTKPKCPSMAAVCDFDSTA